MRPESFGPGAFAVETSAAFSAPIEELVGLRGHAEDDYHGWVRYGNLVSLLMAQAGGDLEELFGLRGTDRGERSAEEFLATRSGPFYTMEQFQDLLHAAYQGLREGANGPPVDLLDPPPLIAADGSAVVRLTNHPAMDLDPAWSPDGDRIAFTSKRDGNNEIYLMNADGSDVIRLTDHPARDSLPAWSPDGARIAFASERDGNLEIYVMNADGSGLTRLTNHAARDWDPAWSPEGARIAFSSVRDRPVEIPGGGIYVMDADGSAVTNLSNNPASDSSPAWSPDGARIAFISHRGTSYRGNTEYQGHAEIYVMNADGSDLTRLTDNPDHKGAPAWSPDGARIAFSFDREGYPEYEIFAINARGGIEVESTQTPASVVVIAPTPVPTPSPTPTPTPSPTPTPAALLESEVTIVEVATRPAIFRAGERVSYTVVVENRGPHVALRPKLVGSVSVALGSLDFLSSYGTCTGTVQSARTIVDCALDDLPPGQLAFVNVDGNLPAGASTVEHLFNVSGHWVESNPTDNSAKDLAVVTPAAIPTPTSTPAAISTPAPGVITATYPVGDGPLALAFDGEHIWVAQGGDDTVMKLRASDGVVLSTHRVGAGPVALAFDGSSIWVANAKNDTVVTQRAFDGEHVWVETRVGDFPSSLTFDGSNVWVANGLGDSVSKISASDGVVLATFPAGRDPNAVVYDGENIWVANGPGQRRYQAQAVGWSHPGHLPRGLRKRTDL
jgi:TolB protein